MQFWIAMLICDCLIPLTMIFGGFYLLKFKPKEINSYIGYRTRLSMKNKDTWNYGNEYCGNLWLKMGFVMLISTILLHISNRNYDKEKIIILALVLLLFQLVSMLVSIILTELSLRKFFDEKGNRKYI